MKKPVSSAGSGKTAGIGRGNHPNSRAGNRNLKPWPKGASGNPSGKPGYDVAAFIARRIFEQYGMHITRAMAKKLLKGDVKAFQVLAERGYGKVPQSVEHTGADGEPLNITITVIDPQQ